MSFLCSQNKSNVYFKYGKYYYSTTQMCIKKNNRYIPTHIIFYCILEIRTILEDTI